MKYRTECELAPGSTTALQLGIGAGNGGCGSEGDQESSNCTNTDGGWRCECYHGFAGPYFEVRGQDDWQPSGQGNRCLNVNECAAERGGCDHICVDRVGAFGMGTHACHCEEGFTLQPDGRTCLPHCSTPCQHGSSCRSPEQCFGCAPGWVGRYCEQAMCDSAIQFEDEMGLLVHAKGCYHGGRCAAKNSCVECLGGWTGSACATSPGAWVGLAVEILGLSLLLPTLVLVLWKRKWLPFQEKGPILLVISNVGCCVWVGASGLAAHPQLVGILPESQTVEPDHVLYGMWLPFTLGFGLWFNAALIRCRNLVLIHLRGEVPYSPMVQLPLLLAPYIVASVLPGRTSYIGWVAVLVLFFFYYLTATFQLIPLRADLDDVVPNTIAGLLALLAMIGLMGCRAAGLSFANPDGSIQVIFPVIFALLGTGHVGYVQSRALMILFRSHSSDRTKSSQSIADKYDTHGGGGSSDSDNEGGTNSGSLWRRALKGSRGLVLAKITGAKPNPSSKEKEVDSSDDAKSQAVAAEQSDGEDSDSGRDSSSDSDTSSELHTTDSHINTQSALQKALEGGAGGHSTSGSRSGGIMSHARGRGRGWNRSSRGRGMARGRGRVRLPALQKASPALALAKAQVRPVAELARAVEAKADDGAESLSDSDSDDSELEELKAEVRKFEKLVERKGRSVSSGGNGKVPAFRGKTWVSHFT